MAQRSGIRFADKDTRQQWNHPVAAADYDMIIGFDPNALTVCIMIFVGQLQVLWPVGKVSFPYGFPSMLIADVDGDGVDEVVISGNDGVGDHPFDVLVLKWDVQPVAL